MHINWLPPWSSTACTLSLHLKCRPPEQHDMGMLHICCLQRMAVPAPPHPLVRLTGDGVNVKVWPPVCCKDIAQDSTRPWCLPSSDGYVARQESELRGTPTTCCSCQELSRAAAPGSPLMRCCHRSQPSGTHAPDSPPALLLTHVACYTSAVAWHTPSMHPCQWLA